LRILIVSQYFFPETGATSNRIYSLAAKFRKEGHKVRILAEKPNHPRGIFFEGYEKGVFLDREYKDIPVTYSWVYTRPEKGFLGRILFYISFMLMAIVASFRMKGQYDIVLASSPPLFVGISGWAIARMKRAKFVFDVRDLWPEVAIKMGELNNGFAINLAEKVEHFLYRKADLITAVTRSFKKSIADKDISGDKIKVITNGTDPELFVTEHSKKELRDNLGLRNHFLVSYIGNLGLAQGLEHIIEAAEQIQQTGLSDISFLIVGAGPKKKELKEIAGEKKLTNVTFVNRVPMEKAVEYMNASDALLVPLANDPIYSQFIPSKLFDSMAASKPVLLSVDGESRDILEYSNAGLYYEAEDDEKLFEKILWLKEHKERAERMGEKGRRYVIENYTREVQAMKMIKELQRII